MRWVILENIANNTEKSMTTNKNFIFLKVS